MKKTILFLSIFHCCCLLGKESLDSTSPKPKTENFKYKAGIVSEAIFDFCPDTDKKTGRYQRFFHGLCLEYGTSKCLNLKTWLGASHFKIKTRDIKDDYFGNFSSRYNFAFALGADWDILARDNYSVRFSPNFYWGRSSVKSAVEYENGQLNVQFYDRNDVKLCERKLSGDLSLIFTKYFLKPSIGVRFVNNTLQTSGNDVDTDDDVKTRAPRSVGLRYGFEVPYSEKILFKVEGGLINETSLKVQGQVKF